MRYLSTRGHGEPGLPFSDVLLAGLAPDGGLYLPESYPRLDRATLGRWRRLLAEEGYASLAYEVLSLFIDDIPGPDLRRLVEAAYTAEAFGGPDIVPVSELGDGLWLAHLSNGPTAAFKDLALQLLGQLFEYELERRGERITIVGATSGDTGSAAEHAMLGKAAVRVFMLSPYGRMTPFQQAQMYSLDDPRIVNVVVDGVFDDCQDLVKEVFADAGFKARQRVGAVNSINVGRLVAQVVYYVAAWLRATSSDTDEVSFCVPSGNFGNIYAAHVAREMGLPVQRLVLATNENNVLAEFFQTGRYRVRGGAETFQTSSPSMDISKASNVERFVFDLLGRDQDRTRRLFGEELARHGRFDLSGDPAFAGQRERFGFEAGTSTHADRVQTIRSTYQRYQVVIDPHTADGVKVARDLAGDEPMVVMETALPVKFSQTVVEALGVEPQRPPRVQALEALPQQVVHLEGGVAGLKRLNENHQG
ncbi:MAG: threonine synthase [Actinomycetia bacterium]|nr:threonine synthase [Actinomycetes bacterium]